MTPQMLSDWCEHWELEVGRLPVQPNIQTAETIKLSQDELLPKLRQLAYRLYTMWVQNLKL
jgi:hypothetical protein